MRRGSSKHRRANQPAAKVTQSSLACCAQPGDYGRARTWASLTWTLFSPIAGHVNARFGIPVGIACYAAGSACAVPAALALPLHALRKRVRALACTASSARHTTLRCQIWALRGFVLSCCCCCCSYH